MSVRELDVLLIEDEEDDSVFAGNILAEIPAPGTSWICGEALESARTRRCDAFPPEHRPGRSSGPEFLQIFEEISEGSPFLFMDDTARPRRGNSMRRKSEGTNTKKRMSFGNADKTGESGIRELILKLFVMQDIAVTVRGVHRCVPAGRRARCWMVRFMKPY